MNKRTGLKRMQLKEASLLANRRGSKSISIVDLIFQIRHNPAKVSRLKTFLSWKDVRKNVKDSDDRAGGDAGDAVDFEDVSTIFLQATSLVTMFQELGPAWCKSFCSSKDQCK